MIGARSALLAATNRSEPWEGFYENVSLLLRNGQPVPTGVDPFADESSTLKPVTIYGNATSTTSLQKYGSSSMVFDGSGDAISVPALDLVSVDFTVECWVYFVGAASNHQIIATSYNGQNTQQLIISRLTTGQVQVSTGGAPAILSSSLQNNQWYHVAFTYQASGGSSRLFVDGILVASTTFSIASQGNKFFIGGAPAIPNISTLFFNGNVDDFRVTRGVVRYASNFTPPTAELPANATDDPSYNSVSLLLRNSGIVYILGASDESPTPKAITTSGSASISTSVLKYGSSALSFNGGYLQTNVSPDFGFGSGDYTVEAWVWLNTGGPADQCLFELRVGDVVGIGFYPAIGHQAQFSITSNTNYLPVVYPLVFSSTYLRDQWTHLAATRQSGTLRIFVNGVLNDSASDTRTYSTSTSLRIGNSIAGQQFYGYADDIRITKGVARYTASFTPPPVELPNY